jgi:hypothetical protein
MYLISAVKFFTLVCLFSEEGKDVSDSFMANIQKFIDFTHLIWRAEPEVTVLQKLSLISVCLFLPEGF